MRQTRFVGSVTRPMKTLRRLFSSLCLVFVLFPVSASADQVEDTKADVAAHLAAGSHVDKVRQFLRVRKFKVTEMPKEKSVSGRLPLDRKTAGATALVVTFHLDDAQIVKAVTYALIPAK